MTFPATSRPFYPKKETSDFLQRKNDFIKSTQQAKEESIRLSSSARDATLIVTTFYPELAHIDDEVEKKRLIIEQWKYWKQFFYDQLNVPF